jgi:hypothetical protein
MAARRTNGMPILKCCWLAMTFTAWLIGLGSCVTEPTCYVANSSSLLFLGFLSFPGSLLFVIVNQILIQLGLAFDATPELYYSYLGLVMIAMGYLQWFHLVPAIFRRRQITQLSLTQTVTLPITLIEPKVQTPAKPLPKPLIKDPLFRPFDKSGRTPLERVINRP